MSDLQDSRKAGRDTESGDGFADVKERVKQRVKETANEYADEGRHMVQDLRGRAELQVRERPLATLAIAAGIGLALGALIARKR